jgi:peptide/nickel transport system ATP-binding protein
LIAPLDQPLLSVRDLAVHLRSSDGPVRAVDGISFDIRAGETLGLVGESGCGKSMTALSILSLIPAAQIAHREGSIRFDGEELLTLPVQDMRRLRGNRIAMIFQEPMTSLNPVLKIGRQIAETLVRHNGLSRRAADREAVELLARVGIPSPKERANEFPHRLSGGMRQRAMIAMAIACRPSLLIADEPTTALDVTVQAQILESLEKAQEETGAAIVLITHDLGVVAGMADEVLVMYAGKPVEVGTVDEIYYSPRMPYTLGLLGSLPRLDQGDEPLTPILGSPPSLINLPPGCPFSPRCPMSRDLCDQEEPELRVVEGYSHRAACHFSDELAGGVRAEDVFSVTARDAAGAPSGAEEPR